MSLRFPGKLSFVAGPLALALAAACSSSTTSTGAPGGSGNGGSPSQTGDASATADGGESKGDGGTGAVTPSDGCGTGTFSAGLSAKTTTVGSVSRNYKLFVPAGYDAKEPTRLVFVFHGRGGSPDEIRAYFGFEAEAAGKALFVYPEGLPQASQGGKTAWSPGDLEFFDAIVTELTASYCVDKSRIFAAGHSFGGYMSNLVGCARGDVVRAIAPVSGGLVPGTCKGPVAAWVAHGDKDISVPPSEGIAARDHWLKENGCTSTSAPTSPAPCVAYDGCTAGHPVTWCSFDGGHYPLPGFTGQAIWDFFAAL